jgi:hypothetical protein
MSSPMSRARRTRGSAVTSRSRKGRRWPWRARSFGLGCLSALLALACADAPGRSTPGAPDRLSGAPDWVRRGCSALDSDRRILCGLGSMGSSRNLTLARSTAIGRARTELARTLQVRVEAMLKDYQSSTSGGSDFGNTANDEHHVVDVSRQITRVSISGSELAETWIGSDGTLHALVIMDAGRFIASVEKMDALSPSLRLALKESAPLAFDE